MVRSRPASRPARIVSVGRLEPDPKWAMRAHAHAFSEVLAAARGKMRVVVDGREFVAGAGEVVVYRPGAVHAETSDPQAPVDLCFVAFDHPGLAADLPAKLADPRGRAAVLISWMLAEQPCSSPARPAVALALLAALVAEINRAAAEEPEPAFLAGARALMRESLAERLSLDDLAAEAGMSKFHFLRRFRVAAGRTPMEELRLLRLEQVKSLVLTTDLPLKAIAPLAGLADEYHLSRLFRKHFGHPPGALRDRAAGRRAETTKTPRHQGGTKNALGKSSW
jgi:AraC-like DNA-binding protein/quercetin dioxygenase-like cupin family protein